MIKRGIARMRPACDCFIVNTIPIGRWWSMTEAVCCTHVIRPPIIKYLWQSSDSELKCEIQAGSQLADHLCKKVSCFQRKRETLRLISRAILLGQIVQADLFHLLFIHNLWLQQEWATASCVNLEDTLRYQACNWIFSSYLVVAKELLQVVTFRNPKISGKIVQPELVSFAIRISKLPACWAQSETLWYQFLARYQEAVMWSKSLNCRLLETSVAVPFLRCWLAAGIWVFFLDEKRELSLLW